MFDAMVIGLMPGGSSPVHNLKSFSLRDDKYPLLEARYFLGECTFYKNMLYHDCTLVS